MFYCEARAALVQYSFFIFHRMNKKIKDPHVSALILLTIQPEGISFTFTFA